MKIFVLLLVVFLILLLNTDIKLKINNVESSKYNVNLGVYFFGIMKIFGLNFTKNHINFLFFIIPYKKIKIDTKKFKYNNIKSILNKLNLKIENMDLFINIGFKDVKLTIFFVFIISTFLSIIPVYYCKKNNLKKYNYKINPIYNKNILNFKLEIKNRLKIRNVSKALLFKKCERNKKQHLNSVQSLVKI